jgi:hypothetical protein
MQSGFKKFRAILAFFILIVLFFSCKKTKTLHNVPYVPVNLTININLPSYSGLQGVGGWCYADGGAKGIVIYRQSNSTFVAFDRQSTVDGGDKCDGIVSDSTNYLILDDPCGDSQYLMTDGSVYHGPAEYGLRAYRTAFDGNYTLQITNY